MKELLQLRDWQQIKQQQAAKLAGMPEGTAALIEAKRYGLAAARIAELEAQIKQMRAALETASGWIVIPERNCSCHLSPPCNNCIERSNAQVDDEQVAAALVL